MPRRMNLTEWKLVLNNLAESNETIEIMWIDSDDEWCLCCGYDLFEYGFKTEQEAHDRISYITNQISLNKLQEDHNGNKI